MLSITRIISLALILFHTRAEDEILLYHSHLTRIKNSLGNKNVSLECSKQLGLYYNALLKKEQWSWQMFKAQSKVPRKFHDLENYNECLAIQTDEVQGKYCLQSKFQETANSTNISICVPHLCSANDASEIHAPEVFKEIHCYTKVPLEFTPEVVATTSIFCLFLFLVILSTSYDIYLYYKNYKPGRDFTMSFSCLTNGRLLFKSSKNHLPCLNGIRALSMIWVVLGHEYRLGSLGTNVTSQNIIEFFEDIGNMFVIRADLAADTFFVIGGLVIVYSFLKITENNGRFVIFLHYLQRYIRLTPAFAFVVLIHATVLKYFGNIFLDHLVEPCRKHYWAALLYIQNYVHGDQICVPQSWYLSIDMQLVLLSPFVLIPLGTKPKVMLTGLVILGFAGICVPFFVAYFEELNAFPIIDSYGGGKTQKYFFSYYVQTYGRFGTYVIGMILGYIVYELKRGGIKVKLNGVLVLFLWVICLAGGLACVYAGHDTMLSEYNEWSHSLYIALNRPAWSLAISGVIFLCVSGHGGPVNVFLSAPIFQFLARISYSIYLVHYEVIVVRAYWYGTGVSPDHFYMLFNFCGDFIISVLLAILLYLIFESPMISLERIISRRGTLERKMRANFNS